MALIRSVGTSTALTAPDVCDAFSDPWSTLFTGNDKSIPILFLNSTEVGTGRRFIEYPFANMTSDVPDRAIFGAATVSYGSLPNSAPLSAVVHNSTRFTYVSPVGTLLRQAVEPDTPGALQLADGGYFENSGLTTLVEAAVAVSQVYKGCEPVHGKGFANPDCPIRIIHISNDETIEPMLGYDECAKEKQRPVSMASEITAPAVALHNTQDARGEYSRAAVVRNYTTLEIKPGPTGIFPIMHDFP